MIPVPSSDSSPHPPPPPRFDGAFTAVFIPLGAIAAVILLFALLTTDQLAIPGLSHRTLATEVSLLGVRLGSTSATHPYVWGFVFLGIFSLIGGGAGFLVGKGLDRLSRLGT